MPYSRRQARPFSTASPGTNSRNDGPDNDPPSRTATGLRAKPTKSANRQRLDRERCARTRWSYKPNEGDAAMT